MPSDLFGRRQFIDSLFVAQSTVPFAVDESTRRARSRSQANVARACLIVFSKSVSIIYSMNIYLGARTLALVYIKSTLKIAELEKKFTTSE